MRQTMRAHHIRDYGWGKDNPLIEVTNLWMDSLRAQGDFNRLLAARGHLDALVASVAKAGKTLRAWDELSAAELSDYLLAAGPAEVFRGEGTFVNQAATMLRLWLDEARARGKLEQAEVDSLYLAMQEAERELLRVHDAYELTAWEFFSEPRGQRAVALRGWLETLSIAESGRVDLSPLHTQGDADAVELSLQLPAAAVKRLKQGDLIWAGVGAQLGPPLLLGPILPALGRQWLERVGWPGEAIDELPVEVQTRFTGSAAAQS